MTPSETAAALQQAADGMNYESETDAPWEVFVWPTGEGIPSADAVKKWGHHKSDAPVLEQTVDEFFATLAEPQDWYGDEEKAVAKRYGSLRDVVKQQLQVPKIYKIGEQKLAVYVLGQAMEGGWAGLKTDGCRDVITCRPLVDILTEPNTNSYRNMTEQEPMMPALVGQVI